MGRGPFPLFHQIVLISFNCFSIVMHCSGWEASMRALRFCASTAAESRAKIWYQ